jgi:hypothetical protein
MGDATVAPFRHLEVNVHGDLNRQWNDSAITISEGGTVTGVTGHVYVFPTARWLLIDLGVQLRRLRLAQQRAGENAEATQQLYFGGVDAVLWNSPTRLLGGEILDDSLARRSYLNDAGILSYRHYRLHGESTPDFTARLVLAPEAAIHQGSGLFRKVFARNRGGIDLRGGVGYDTARELMLYSAGVSLVAAPSWPVRVLVSYDWAKESTTGFQGIRHTGWVTYHADI